jgi:hypothetical protein
MAALPIYAKVNKLEKLQNDLAQIATKNIINEVIIPRIKTNLKHIVNCLLITLKMLLVNSSLLSVSPAMAALPIYAKVNKLEKLQNDSAQITTYGIYAQRDMGHLDIDDNFFKRASMTTELIRVVLLIRKVAGINPA